MSRQLPELIEPLRLAELRRSLKGEIDLKRMKRLAGSLVVNQGVAKVDLLFAYDDTGLPTVSGTVAAQLNLCCQRCMETMVHSVQSEIHLGLVRSDDEAKQLAARYEPFLVTDEQCSLTEMVEDELILSLPAVPRHEVEQCPAGDQYIAKPEQRTEVEQQEKTEKPNPFAVLAKLKNKQD